MNRKFLIGIGMVWSAWTAYLGLLLANGISGGLPEAVFWPILGGIGIYFWLAYQVTRAGQRESDYQDTEGTDS